jgi:chromate reductase
MRLLAISGSLRTGSSNHALLRAITQVASDVALTLYDGVARLPHFSPDLDITPAPPEVAALRTLVREADALVISSPEYAHALPGSLKNALDWLVSSGEIMDKHVLVWSASGSGATYSHEQLLEVMRTLTSNTLTSASLRITRARQAFAADGTLHDESLAAELAASLGSLRRALAARG